MKVSLCIVTVLFAMVGSISPWVRPTARAQSPIPGATQGALNPPFAPGGIHVSLSTRSITWVDNSDDETGFRITFSMSDDGQPDTVMAESYTVEANTTSVQISEAAARFPGDRLEITVVAFNDAGDSTPTTVTLALDAGPSTPLPPTVPTPRLPATGVGGNSACIPDSCGVPVVPLGAALALGGIALVIASYVRRRA